MVPCCFGRMGSLGDQCADAQQAIDTYTRLSLKTDKSAETRANATQMVNYWKNIQNNCKLTSAIGQAQQQQQAILQATMPGGVAPDYSRWLTYGGLGLGAAVVLYLVMRRRG